MPSNYKKLAVDFDRDGSINLNKADDSIGSIAHYFKQSGWQRGLDVAIPAAFLGSRYTNQKVGYQYPYKRSDLKNTRPKRPFRYQGDIYLVKLERANFDELWYGTQNFYAITRYNHSDYYAMAVFQLAEMIAGRSVKQTSGTLIIQENDLDTFLDAPLQKQKFIIELE